MLDCPACILGSQIWRYQGSLLDAILGFLKHLGFQTVVKATEKLSAKNTVTPLLDKASGELPPPPAKKAAPAPVREVKTAASRDREPSESRPATADREKK